MTTTEKQPQLDLEIYHLLLVEDNEGDSFLITEYLDSSNRFKFQLDIGTTLSQGIESLGKKNYDLVLLDLTLPDCNGLSTFRGIQKYSRQIPIIILTGLESDEVALESLREGAHDFIVKGSMAAEVFVRIIRYAIERNNAEEALRISRERYQVATMGANDGIWDWDLLEDSIFYSFRWKLIIGFNNEEISTSPDEWFSRIHEDDVIRVKMEIETHISGSAEHFQSEFRMKHKAGYDVWVLCRGLVLKDTNGIAYRMAGSLTDITDRKMIEEKLKFNSLHDSLTGLTNRTLFMDRLEHAFEIYKRNHEKVFAVLFLDLDRFKIINDSLGHLAGDELLRKMSFKLNELLRTGDTVGRFGGDEFTIILENIRVIEDAELVAERILASLSEPVSLQGHEIIVTGSIGIVMVSEAYQSAEEILRDADITMYRAKHNGKARFEIFNRTINSKVVSLLSLENDLRKSIDRGELALVYQPIIDIKSKSIMSYEVLLRWQHKTKGFISPVEFIPSAEDTGFIIEIGKWVLEEACSTNKILKEKGYDLNFSVNFSPKQFEDKNLSKHIEQILEKTGQDSNRLIAEITENTAMKDVNYSINLLNYIKELGISVSIDDFGTGYSSLNYLKRFPIDNLKIDRSFVSDLVKDNNSSIVVNSIISLAHNLKLKVIAEGVETIEQYQYLIFNSCNAIQGYLISKPLSIDDFTDFLNSFEYKKLPVERGNGKV